MKKQIILVFGMLVLACSSVFAQDYKAAVGVRLGEGMTGLDVKYNMNASNSIEGIVDFVNGINVVGLYEFNNKLSQSFNFYYGFGANLGVWNGSDNNVLTLGVDGVVGIEYIFPSIPFAISLDYKPFLNILGVTGFHGTDFGLGLKFTF